VNAETEMDKKATCGVYLCQVNEKVSCGACCGLYNIPDLSRKKLCDMLLERTTGFSKVPREIEAITRFGEEILSEIGDKRPYDEFYHCPFIGFIGKGKARAGCLLHPFSDGNNGVDYRGLGYYGSMTCHIYFCPSYTRLPENHKRVVRESADDWYSYGLIITETALISAFFSEIESRFPEIRDEADIGQNQTLLNIVKAFIDLKVSWPFRPPSETAANYFFKDKLYERKPVDYSGINDAGRVSRHDVIFRELGSNFKSAEELRYAESILDNLFDRARSLNL
jgi:hypothetical protein